MAAFALSVYALCKRYSIFIFHYKWKEDGMMLTARERPKQTHQYNSYHMVRVFAGNLCKYAFIFVTHVSYSF